MKIFSRAYSYSFLNCNKIKKSVNLVFLNDALSSIFIQYPKICDNYKIGKIEMINEYWKQIFIDPYLTLTTKKTSNENLDISTMLYDIPKTVIVQHQIY